VPNNQIKKASSQVSAATQTFAIMTAILKIKQAWTAEATNIGKIISEKLAIIQMHQDTKSQMDQSGTYQISCRSSSTSMETLSPSIKFIQISRLSRHKRFKINQVKGTSS
jgi:hypothetical protein